MSRFRMNYPYARDFHSKLGHVTPGQEVEADENPDPRFFDEVDETAKVIAARQATTTTTGKSKKADAAVTEPTTETEEQV